MIKIAKNRVGAYLLLCALIIFGFLALMTEVEEDPRDSIPVEGPTKAISKNSGYKTNQREDLVESGMIVSPREYADYVSIAPDGSIPSEVAELAGLDSNEVKILQRILSGTWERMGDLVRENMLMNSSASDPANDVFVYDISSFSDEGQYELHKMEEAIDLSFGKSASNIIKKGINPGNFFGGFGKNDVRMKFYLDDFEGVVSRRVDVVYKSPHNGKIIGSNSIEVSYLAEFYGNSISPDAVFHSD